MQMCGSNLQQWGTQLTDGLSHCPAGFITMEDSLPRDVPSQRLYTVTMQMLAHSCEMQESSDGWFGPS